MQPLNAEELARYRQDGIVMPRSGLSQATVQALSAKFRNGEWIAAIDSLIGWEHTSTAVIRSERPTAPPTTRGEPIR